MLYIKAGTFIYIYLTVSIARMLSVSMQYWRMVQALRSHGRCLLVVSSDEMSPYTSHSRTVESLATKHGWTSQTAESVDNRFTPQYNRFIYCLL